MERFLNTNCDPQQMSPLTLAFIGDAVFEVFVRERIVCSGSRPVSELHRLSVRQVCCSAQAIASEKLLNELSEEEMNVFRRGRNAHTGHIPKHAEMTDYHTATALEALFGYLYLNNRLDRLRELFNIISEYA